MNEDPTKYTGHDFAELMTTTLARAEAIALLLRSEGIDARAAELSGWTFSGPPDEATVLVPRPQLEQARARLKEPLEGEGDADEHAGGPVVCPELDARRSRMRPIAVALLLIIVALTTLVVLTRPYGIHHFRGFFLPW